MRWVSAPPTGLRMRGTLGPAWLSVLVACAGATTACSTVDLGDNFVPPELMLDEDFFYCQIQPNVIARNTCASGAAGEGGQCHSSRSALRLSSDAETAAPPDCGPDNVPGSAVPMSYMDNFQAVQFTVQSDPQSSPFYRRPIALDSHPRQIFDEASGEADLVVQWISMGAR